MMKSHNAALLAVALLFFAFGMFTSYAVFPNVQIVTVEKEKEVVKYIDRTVETKNAEKEEKVNTHTEKTETVHTDGTIVRKEVTDTNTDKKEKVVEIKYVDVIVEKTVEKIVEVSKETKQRNNWAINGMLATAPLNLRPSLTAPFFDPIIVGVSVQRRIIGPLWAGGMVMSDTKLANPTVGVTVGIQF